MSAPEGLPPVRHVPSADGVLVQVLPCRAGGAVIRLPTPAARPEWYPTIAEAEREVRARTVYRR